MTAPRPRGLMLPANPGTVAVIVVAYLIVGILAAYWYGWAGYLAVGIAFLIWPVWYHGWDVDLGGYRDRYFDDRGRVMPDKANHAAFGFVLMLLAGSVIRGPWWHAVIPSLILGIGWDFQQWVPREQFRQGRKRGAFKWRDVVADASGIAAASFIHWLVRVIF